MYYSPVGNISIRCFILLFIVICIYGSIVYLCDIRTISSKTRYIKFSRLINRKENSTEILKKYNWPMLLNFNVTQNISKTYIGNNLNKEKVIILFNGPKNLRLPQLCRHLNCMFTRETRTLLNADAIVFYAGHKNDRMGKVPPVNESTRKPNQVWIFTSDESPDNIATHAHLISWQNTLNWSVHYTLHSDIPYPYGTLVNIKAHEHKDYGSIYKQKTRNALWIVSHCQTSSARRKYVDKMIQYGFDVDIRGNCSSNGTWLSYRMFREILPSYKFYLAFENSLCTDYLSEKYFSNYNFNWIIVVRGGADYHRLLPAKTFISTSDFSNLSSLVNYLKDIGNDENGYVNLLRHKDRYISVDRPVNFYCEICTRLYNLSEFRKKSYYDISLFFSKDQCVYQQTFRKP